MAFSLEWCEVAIFFIIGEAFLVGEALAVVALVEVGDNEVGDNEVGKVGMNGWDEVGDTDVGDRCVA